MSEVQASKISPANVVEKAVATRDRIPMSLPQMKLAVPEIPGWHLHWMAGTPERLAQAQRAGYVFVEDDEVNVSNPDLAGSASKTGNQDMGSRVSLVSGAGSADGQASRLYLMKIKEEFWQQDQKQLEDRNEQIAATLRGGATPQANPHGTDGVYIPEVNRKTNAELFQRKTRRA